MTVPIVEPNRTVLSILAAFETEIRPQLDDPQGYNCCECSTRGMLFEDMRAVVTRHLRDQA